MQGRDPDQEGEAAGQGPPPGPEYDPAEQPFYGGFAVPDNPYGEPETGDLGPAEPDQPPAPQPEYQQPTEAAHPGADEPPQPPAPQPQHQQPTEAAHPGADEPPQPPAPPDTAPMSGRGLFEPRRPAPEPPARPDAEKATEAFRTVSRDQEAGRADLDAGPEGHADASAPTESFGEVRGAHPTPEQPAPPGDPVAGPDEREGTAAQDTDAHHAHGEPTGARLSTQPPPRPPGPPPGQPGPRPGPPDPPPGPHPQQGGQHGPPPPPGPQHYPAGMPPYGAAGPRGGRQHPHDPHDPFAPPHNQAGQPPGTPPPAQGGQGYHQPTSAYDFSDIQDGPKRGMRSVLIAVAAVTVALALGGGAFAYATYLRDGAGAEQGPIGLPNTPETSDATGASAESPAPSPPASPSFDPALIRNTRKDAKPLRVAEAFPDKVASVSGREFERVATDMAGKCAKAGQRGFDRTLGRAGCERVLRATFVDRRTDYAVTTGVAVLPTAEDARKVEKAAKAGRNVWFAALPGPKGSGAERIHRSGGYSALEVVGHYVVFSFAAYADRITPPPDSSDLSKLCARMRNYAAQPVVARGMTSTGQ